MAQGDRGAPLQSRPMAITALAAAAAVVGLMLPAAGSSDSSVPWTSFSESTTCGRPYVGTPIMSRSGWLPDAERILGPLGHYLGRTVGEARSSLVDWVVPMSGGRRVRVHRAALPAFEQVSANLATAAAGGLWYQVTGAIGFAPRTIGGEHQLSRHAFGISVDINPARNPYSPDPSVLVTDMPQWFVQAWRDAGFCWGGDWAFSKDPMHFSWMGPAPASGGLPMLPPFGSATPYAASDTFSTGWGGLAASGRMALADVTASGAADVVRLRDHPAGLVMEVLSARSAFGRCSLSRWMVEGVSIEHGLPALGDIDGDSRTDLVSVSASGTIVVAPRTAEFAQSTSRAVPVPPGLRAALVADHDGDRRGDLHLLGDGGALLVLKGPDFTTTLAETTLPGTVGWLAAGDRDGNGSVELFAVDPSGVVSIMGRTSDATFAVTESALVDVTGAVAVAATDLDGDQRADLAVLTDEGLLRLWVGNTPTGRPTSAWWVDPGYECPDHVIPLEYRGPFYDDDPTGYEFAIDRIAAAGVTTGCNPPFGDAFCPTRPVTRAEMAAFLARALGLPAASEDAFVDDDGSVHEADIGRIAAAGITRGCAPSRFCPDALVSRAEMAAFLVRAAPIAAPTGADPFSDDDGNPFEAEIAALAAAGITEGCGPGLFCPHAAVSRAEMAVFLVRLLDWPG